MIKSSYRVALQTIVHKEIVRILRIWTQTLLPPAITATLYFLIFGSFIGRHIQSLEGFSYVLFITPGLIMMGAMLNSYMNVSSSFYGAKFQRNIDEILVAPVPHYIILWGYLSGGIFRGLLVAFVTTVVATFFTHMHIVHPLLTFLAIFLAVTLFSIAGFINGLIARRFDDVNIIPSFVLTPLIYMGGVFYSIKALGGIWQSISQFNPVLYIVNAFRYGMLGQSDVSIQVSFAMMLVFIAILYTLSIYLLRKGIGLRN